jgi:cellulose synthase/poly-beta-1,6-N-acetylglucosamine synthase-like glycosyltransferase
LAALAQQRYPGPWRLQLVVDSLADPAWAVAEASLAALETRGQASWQAAQLEPLQGRPQRGSLKSASLRQAFAHLHPATALVALVDADAIVSPDWLADLARACSQPGVGAVSGNRWYQPQAGSLAAQVRAGWNGGALVLMTLLGIPWGGSLAVRRQVIDAGTWSERLISSLCEDTSLVQPLRQLGWRYAFRPELITIDQDDSMALAGLAPWIGRQLLTARLHHPAWPLVALHGASSALLLLAASAWLLLAHSGILAGALGLYELGCAGLLLWIEATALSALARRECQTILPKPGPFWRRAWDWLANLPITQLTYALAFWVGSLWIRYAYSNCLSNRMLCVTSFASLNRR